MIFTPCDSSIVYIYLLPNKEILVTRIAVTGAAPLLDEHGGGGDEGDLQHRHHGRHPAQGAHLASQVAAHSLVTPAAVNTARCRAEYKAQ